MKLMRAGILLFLTTLASTFVFAWMTGLLAGINAPKLVIALSALLAMASAYSMYGGVVLAVSGYAIRKTDNWMPVGLRMALTGAALFLLIQIVVNILSFLRLPLGFIQLFIALFIFTTITVTISGIFIVVADVAKMISDRRGSRL